MAYAKGKDVRVFLTALCYKCKELVAISIQITQKEY
jgi:hypothetical protein